MHLAPKRASQHEHTRVNIQRLPPPSAGACTEQVRLFCGRVSSATAGGVHGLAEEGENILVHSVPVAAAFELVALNRIPNGHTLISLLWLQNNIDTLRERWG